MKLPATWLFVSIHSAGQLSEGLRGAILESWAHWAKLPWMFKVNQLASVFFLMRSLNCFHLAPSLLVTLNMLSPGLLSQINSQCSRLQTSPIPTSRPRDSLSNIYQDLPSLKPVLYCVGVQSLTSSFNEGKLSWNLPLVDGFLKFLGYHFPLPTQEALRNLD
jgi:hypothetical protein